MRLKRVRAGPQRFRIALKRNRLERCDRGSGGPETQHAVGDFRRQAALVEHVIDVRDQLAGSKAHLVHVEWIFVKHDRHQFPRGLDQKSVV